MSFKRYRISTRNEYFARKMGKYRSNFTTPRSAGKAVLFIHVIISLNVLAPLSLYVVFSKIGMECKVRNSGVTSIFKIL